MQIKTDAIAGTDPNGETNAGVTLDSVVFAEYVICSICALNTVAIQ